MSKLFSFAGQLWQVEGDRLIKAGKKVSPGQLDLFGGGDSGGDGQHHAGGGGEDVNGHHYKGGQFTPGHGGMAAAAKADDKDKTEPESKSDATQGASVAEREARKFGQKAYTRLRNIQYVKYSKAEAPHFGLNPNHPGLGWDEYEHQAHLEAYKKGGTAAVGRKILNSLDLNNEEDLTYATRLANISLDAVDWNKASQRAKKLLNGEQVESSEGANSIIDSVLDDHIENLKDEEFDDSDRQDFADQVASPEAAKNYINELLKPKYENFEFLNELANFSRDNLVNPEHVGEATVKGMKLHESSQFNGKLVEKPWEESENGLASNAVHTLDHLTDWQAVAQSVNAVLEGKQPSGDAAVKFVTEQITEALKDPATDSKWRQELQSDLKNPKYSPARIVKLSFHKLNGISSDAPITDSLKQVQAKTRGFLEGGEGRSLYENRLNNPTFRDKALSNYENLLNTTVPWQYERELAEMAGVGNYYGQLSSDKSKWKEKTVEMLAHFGVKPEDSRKAFDRPMRKSLVSFAGQLWQVEGDRLIKKNLQKSAEPIKYVLRWKGCRIGVTHDEGDKRHGRILKARYGHVQGTYGVPLMGHSDGMSWDVWVGKDLGSDQVFAVKQVKKFDTGEIDEYKLILGCHSEKEATDLYCSVMPKKLYGGISKFPLKRLLEYAK